MRPTTTGSVPPINAGSGGYRLGAYREWAVADGLGRVAEVAWTHGSSAVEDRGIPLTTHRVIPETGVSLCLLTWRDPTERVREAHLALMGPIRTPRFFEPASGEGIAAIRLKAEWCRELLGVDPADHVDRLDPLPPIVRRRLGRYRDDLLATPGRLAALPLLGEAIGVLWQDLHPARSSLLAHACLQAVRDRPTDPDALRDRAGALGVSERHLRRTVRRTTGRGAKYFHRVRRLQRAVSAADGRATLEWASLAIGSGYCDQAHMIREFRDFTGLTPVELRAERARQALPDPSDDGPSSDGDAASSAR